MVAMVFSSSFQLQDDSLLFDFEMTVKVEFKAIPDCWRLVVGVQNYATPDCVVVNPGCSRRLHVGIRHSARPARRLLGDGRCYDGE